MITVRRGDERKHVRRRQREAWLTFAAQDQSTLVPSGFGPLTVFEEGRLPPRTSHRKPIREEAEIITCVREGTLAYEDSTQLWLRPSVVGLEPGHEQILFSIAQRRGLLRVVASPDGQNGSLLIHQDALLFSTILDRGQHVVHELSEGRCAWLHIVQGTARCGVVTMGTGDGAGIEAEPSVSLTASEETEVLLLDLSASSSSGELT
jgi:redox-sensitive bicupin YhaK (pirin superfamily)